MSPIYYPFNGHMDEEQLITAVLRIKLDGSASTASEVHAALIAEGHKDLTLSQVKKAASKATKRQGDVPKPQEPVATGEATAASASKKEQKAKAQAESIMKAAETHMMEMNRLLRLAIGDDEYSAAIATSDRGEKFIKIVTERALSAQLTEADAPCPRERLAADLATLEWMLLAEKGGTLNLPEEARETATTQIERLKGIRARKTYEADKADRSWVSECFLLPEADAAATAVELGPPSGVDYTANSGVVNREATGASLDRLVAKSGMLAVGGGFDDDID